MKYTIPIKPRTWKRMRGGKTKKRFMQAVDLEYYATIYMALLDAGMKPFPVDEELRAYMEFHTTDRRWRDIDNLIKAVLDACQPSHWAKHTRGFEFMVDFFDDRQIAQISAIRFRGVTENKLTICLRELPCH